METALHLLNTKNSTGECIKKEEWQSCVKIVNTHSHTDLSYFDFCCSGHCFCQGVVSGVSSASPLTKSHHMVALVSLPPHAGVHRGLTVETDASQDNSPLVTVTEWVFIYRTEIQRNQCHHLQHTESKHALFPLTKVGHGRPQSRPAVLHPHWRSSTGGQWCSSL